MTDKPLEPMTLEELADEWHETMKIRDGGSDWDYPMNEWSAAGKRIEAIQAEFDRRQALLTEIGFLRWLNEPWNGPEGTAYESTELETEEYYGHVSARLRITVSSRSDEANPPYEHGTSYTDARAKAIAAFDARCAKRHPGQCWAHTPDLHNLGDE